MNQIFDMTLYEFKQARSVQCVIAQLFFSLALFAKIPRILLSIDINANCRCYVISCFLDETLSFRFEVVSSFRTIKFNIVFLFRFQNLSFAECRSKKGKFVLSKSAVFIYGKLYPA